MKEIEKDIQDNTNFNSPLGVGGNIQNDTNSSSPLGVRGQGKTAKYLREKLGGIPEQAKENLKVFNAIKKQILEALKDEDLTIKQLTEKLNMPSDEVVYYLMSLVKYGFVKTGEVDDMDEYYTYKLNK
jgi:predicted Rossmann fold nucleotide-binding protein DprA/Smf involved in DNA uptake